MLDVAQGDAWRNLAFQRHNRRVDRVKNRGGASGSTGSGSGTGDTGGLTTEKGRKKCNDGIDNDGDGLIDGADPDC